MSTTLSSNTGDESAAAESAAESHPERKKLVLEEMARKAELSQYCTHPYAPCRITVVPQLTASEPIAHYTLLLLLLPLLCCLSFAAVAPASPLLPLLCCLSSAASPLLPACTTAVHTRQQAELCVYRRRCAWARLAILWVIPAVLALLAAVGVASLGDQVHHPWVSPPRRAGHTEWLL